MSSFPQAKPFLHSHFQCLWSQTTYFSLIKKTFCWLWERICITIHIFLRYIWQNKYALICKITLAGTAILSIFHAYLVYIIRSVKVQEEEGKDIFRETKDSDQKKVWIIRILPIAMKSTAPKAAYVKTKVVNPRHPATCRLASRHQSSHSYVRPGSVWSGLGPLASSPEAVKASRPSSEDEWREVNSNPGVISSWWSSLFAIL